MRNLRIIFVLLILLAVSLNSQPRIILSVTGGYGAPLAQLRGNIDSVSYSNKESYFMKTGYYFGLTGKYAVDKKGKIRINLGGSYNRFSGEGTFNHTYKIDYHSHIAIISANLGAEYAFSPKQKTSPFIGFELNGNFFSGEIEETATGSSALDHGDSGMTTMKLKSESRFGFALGGGVDVSLSKNIAMTFGVKYNFANLIGKKYSSSSAAGEYNLNDKEDNLNKAKNIMYLQLYLGVTFNFNHIKKK